MFQGIFSYINERDTSSTDCKYKHMLENGALPDKFGVLYQLLHIEFHDLNSRIDVLGLSHLCSWYEFQLFTDGMGPFKGDLLLSSNIRPVTAYFQGVLDFYTIICTCFSINI